MPASSASCEQLPRAAARRQGAGRAAGRRAGRRARRATTSTSSPVPGSTWAEAFYYGMCILEEMQWIRTRPVHASDFFHGTLELVEPGVSVVLLKGEDAGRPLVERVEKFAPRPSPTRCSCSTRADYDLPGIDADVRSLVSPVVLAAVLERVSAHLEVRDRPPADHPSLLQARGVLRPPWLTHLLTVGDNVVDQYPERGVLYPGGNAVNVAVHARRLRRRTRPTSVRWATDSGRATWSSAPCATRASTPRARGSSTDRTPTPSCTSSTATGSSPRATWASRVFDLDADGLRRCRRGRRRGAHGRVLERRGRSCPSWPRRPRGSRSTSPSGTGDYVESLAPYVGHRHPLGARRRPPRRRWHEARRLQALGPAHRRGHARRRRRRRSSRASRSALRAGRRAARSSTPSAPATPSSPASSLGLVARRGRSPSWSAPPRPTPPQPAPAFGAFGHATSLEPDTTSPTPLSTTPTDWMCHEEGCSDELRPGGAVAASLAFAACGTPEQRQLERQAGEPDDAEPRSPARCRSSPSSPTRSTRRTSSTWPRRTRRPTPG